MVLWAKVKEFKNLSKNFKLGLKQLRDSLTHNHSREIKD
jgi:hypothetical protein